MPRPRGRRATVRWITTITNSSVTICVSNFRATTRKPISSRAGKKSFSVCKNLYAAPYNRYETDQLETLLVALNHRVMQGVDGGWFQAGAYYRRNVDDYTFDRLAPPPAIPYHHVTQALGAGLEGSVPVFATAGTEGGGGGEPRPLFAIVRASWPTRSTRCA